MMIERISSPFVCKQTYLFVIHCRLRFGVASIQKDRIMRKFTKIAKIAKKYIYRKKLDKTNNSHHRIRIIMMIMVS